MKIIIKTALVAAAFVGATAAHAVQISYQGSIVVPPGETVTGQVGGFGWNRELASEVDFWSFVGYANTVLRIEGMRTDAALDPALALYFGITGADESEFRNGVSFSGVTFLASADDENESSVGPFGDPVLTYALPFTGFYTVAIGGNASLDEGPYSYTLSVSAVPEVGTWLLMTAGLASLYWRRRKHAPRRHVD